MAHTTSTATTAAHPGHKGAISRPFTAWMVGLALLAFALGVAFSLGFAGTGVQFEWNVLLDADPNVYLKNFSTGYTIGTWGGRGFVHPNLTNAVHPPIRLLSFAYELLPGHTGSTLDVRQALAWLVSPVVAAVRVVFVMLLLRVLGLSLAWSVMLAALDLLSFSTLLFSSIPESYSFTGAALAALFWLGARTACTDRPPGRASWWVAATAATGVATLDLGAAAIIRAVTEASRRPLPRALAATAAMCGVALVLNFVGLKTSELLIAPDTRLAKTVPHIADAWNPGIERALIDYPRALANGIAVSRPVRWYHPEPMHVHPYLLTLERGRPGVIPWDPRATLVLMLLVLGLTSYRWLPRGNRVMHLAAVLVLAEGAIVHAFFGKELVLYTQHWHLAAMVLLAGLYYMPVRALNWAMPAALAAVAVNNLLSMSYVLRILRLP